MKQQKSVLSSVFMYLLKSYWNSSFNDKSFLNETRDNLWMFVFAGETHLKSL